MVSLWDVFYHTMMECPFLAIYCPIMGHPPGAPSWSHNTMSLRVPCDLTMDWALSLLMTYDIVYGPMS